MRAQHGFSAGNILCIHWRKDYSMSSSQRHYSIAPWVLKKPWECHFQCLTRYSQRLVALLHPGKHRYTPETKLRSPLFTLPPQQLLRNHQSPQLPALRVSVIFLRSIISLVGVSHPIPGLQPRAASSSAQTDSQYQTFQTLTWSAQVNPWNVSGATVSWPCSGLNWLECNKFNFLPITGTCTNVLSSCRSSSPRLSDPTSLTPSYFLSFHLEVLEESKLLCATWRGAFEDEMLVSEIVFYVHSFRNIAQEGTVGVSGQSGPVLATEIKGSNVGLDPVYAQLSASLRSMVDPGVIKWALVSTHPCEESYGVAIDIGIILCHFKGRGNCSLLSIGTNVSTYRQAYWASFILLYLPVGLVFMWWLRLHLRRTHACDYH